MAPSTKLTFWVVIAVVALGLLSAARAQPSFGADVAAGATPRLVMRRGPLSADERNTIAVFESASRSVVYITTVQHVRDFFSRNVMRVPQGTGSGFIWDERGRVVTNFHVIRGAQEALVRLGDQRSFSAKLVGASPEHDLAVLEIDVPENLPREGAGGVLVLGVARGSPAERAGLRATVMERNGNVLLGDVVEAVDGRRVESFAALVDVLDVLDGHEFGDRVTLTVRRGNGSVEVPVTLGNAAARSR